MISSFKSTSIAAGLLVCHGALAGGKSEPTSVQTQTTKVYTSQKAVSRSSSKSLSSSVSKSDAKSVSNAHTGNQEVEVRTGDHITKVPRQAPDVTAISSPTTADMMVCYGIGGSNSTGAATGLWCRLQRDLYAIHRSERYAKMGDRDAASEAYCARKLHWKDFGSQESCITKYKVMLGNEVVELIEPVVQDSVNVYVQSCEETKRDPDAKGFFVRGKNPEQIECFIDPAN